MQEFTGTISITAHGMSLKQADALLEVINTLMVTGAVSGRISGGVSGLTTMADTSAEETAPKRKRRTKAEMQAATNQEARNDDLKALEEDDGSEDSLAETIVTSKVAKLSFDKDLLPVLREYNKKHGKEKFVKALARFGVKTARDIPTSAYDAAIKAFKV